MRYPYVPKAICVLLVFYTFSTLWHGNSNYCIIVPVTYVFNTLMVVVRWDNKHPLWLLMSGAFVLCCVVGLTLWITRPWPPGQRKQEFFCFCVFAVFSFTGVVTLITGLELDGMISGFMSAFLKNGEPYLRSAHGAMISYWHGTGMYAMYLMMMAAITWNNTFYEVALFWCGSMSNSMIVLILSVFTGKYGLTWGSALYLPYVIIPPAIIFRLCQQKQIPQTSVLPKSLRRRPWDIIFLIYLFLAGVIAVFRALAVLESELGAVHQYLTVVEPYLELRDPAPFPKMQMLVYLFYYVPLYILSIYGLVSPGCTWMPDLSILHAGAALQAQISHMGASLHPRTPYILRVPPDTFARTVFWSVNLTLAVVPQLLAYRCMDHPDFFALYHRAPSVPRDVKTKTP